MCPLGRRVMWQRQSFMDHRGIGMRKTSRNVKYWRDFVLSYSAVVTVAALEELGLLLPCFNQGQWLRVQWQQELKSKFKSSLLWSTLVRRESELDFTAQILPTVLSVLIWVTHNGRNDTSREKQRKKERKTQNAAVRAGFPWARCRRLPRASASI